jgi:hypothetical protein
MLHVWQRTTLFHIRSIHINSDIPPGARAQLPQPGERLFGFSAREQARRIESEFPELESVKVTRTWTGSVRAEAKRRKPLARIRSESGWQGIDSSEVLFPITAEEELRLPALDQRIEGYEQTLALHFIQRLPDTSWGDRVIRLEGRPPQSFVLALTGDIRVRWGPYDSESFPIKSRRLARVLDEMAKKEWAGDLQFIRDDRIVLKSKKDLKVPKKEIAR